MVDGDKQIQKEIFNNGVEYTVWNKKKMKSGRWNGWNNGYDDVITTSLR